jgi:tripartite-type tricarboxylate transporter receptor subunit TctC
MPSRRDLGRLVAATGLGLAAARPGLAQPAAWPDRPVRVVVPFGPGGAPDILARLMAPHFPAQARGQQLQVENRSGAGGTIGAGFVAQSRPDALTLLMAEQGSAALAHELYRDLSYDPRRSFTPIIFLVDLPMVLVTRPGLPAHDVAAVLEQARRQPGSLSYGSVGVGHIGHLAMEALQRRAGEGARMLHVIYRSGGDIMTALVKGEIDMTIGSYSSALSFLQSNAVRPIAVTTASPLAELPGVPTLAATVPGMTATLWYGLLGPAGIPAEVVAQANAAFNAVLAVPELRAAVRRAQASDPIGGAPERFAEQLSRETARWTPVVRAAGVRAE